VTATERRRRRKRRARLAQMRASEGFGGGFGGYIEKRDGRVIPAANMLDWAVWMGRADRRVARDQVEDIMVSTVFLGLDHGSGFSPVPILYETMTCDSAEKWGGPWRYATRAAALEGHARILALVESGVPPEGIED
jgi:hypothetical protein